MVYTNINTYILHPLTGIKVAGGSASKTLFLKSVNEGKINFFMHNETYNSDQGLPFIRYSPVINSTNKHPYINIDKHVFKKLHFFVQKQGAIRHIHIYIIKFNCIKINIYIQIYTMHIHTYMYVCIYIYIYMYV